RVDLDLRAHARRAVLDALLQRPRRTRVNVLDGPRLLHRRNALDRIDLARLFGRTAVDDARLVEMDVRLDQSGANEPPAVLVFPSWRPELRRDPRDAPILDPDVDNLFGPGVQAHVADDEIHGSPAPYLVT